MKHKRALTADATSTAANALFWSAALGNTEKNPKLEDKCTLDYSTFKI
jgi:hypothetical protein